MAQSKNKHLRGIRALALLLCACLAVALVGSAVFLAAHSLHHCAEAHCQTCQHLHQARQALERLFLCGGGAGLWLLATAACAFALLCEMFGFATATPVLCRVRLNN